MIRFETVQQRETKFMVKNAKQNKWCHTLCCYIFVYGQSDVLLALYLRDHTTWNSSYLLIMIIYKWNIIGGCRLPLPAFDTIFIFHLHHIHQYECNDTGLERNFDTNTLQTSLNRWRRNTSRSLSNTLSTNKVYFTSSLMSLLRLNCP